MFARLALAAGVLTSAVAAAPAQAADPIMPLSSVRAGMKCTALSVVRGTQISQFDAEVLDVITGDSESDGPRILVRVSGPAVDSTGVGPGFSGSPILCPDAQGVKRNAGAISETLGEFGNKVVLATPIEQILGQGPEAPRAARSDAAMLRRARPVATPMTVSGLSGPLRARLGRIARRAGRAVLATPGGPLGGFPAQDLRPGASVSAGLSSGDVSIGAVGTIAYRNGTAVWAFGHPLDGAGRRALALQDAYVFTVINNPLGIEEGITSKLAVPGRTVGALTNDGIAQVSGRLGRPPRTIPVRVNVTDGDTGRTASLRSEATDERHLELGSALDLVGSLSLTQGVLEVLGSAPPLITSELCVRIRVRERRRRLGFCDKYLDEGFGPFDDLSEALSLVDAFKFGRLTPTDVSIRMRVRRDVKEALIVAAKAPRRVRPGRRIRIRLLLQRRRGRRTLLSFRYRVPRTLRPGRRTLTIRGVVPSSLSEGSDEGLEVVLESLGLGGNDDVGPRSISELDAGLTAIGAPEGVRATFRRRGKGPIVLRSPGLLIRGKAQIPFRVVRRSR